MARETTLRDDGDRAVHAVRAAREQGEEPAVFGRPVGLAERLTAEGDRGVGGEDHPVGEDARERPRLGPRETEGEPRGIFARAWGLVDLGRRNHEGDPEERKKNASAGRGRGEDETGRIHARW